MSIMDAAGVTAVGADSWGALIDQAFVAEMFGEYGAELVAEVVASLTEESTDALVRLAEAPDAAAAGRLLHFLRGSALNTGLSVFAARCEELESAARAGTMPDPEASAALAGLFDASCAQLSLFAATLDG